MRPVVIEIPQPFKRILAKAPHVRGQIDATLHEYCQWLPAGRMPFFPEYTDHRATHMQDVLDHCARLMSTESLRQMSEHDIAVLVLAVLLHDVAMHFEQHNFCALVSGSSHLKPVVGFGDRPWTDLWTTYVKESRTFSKSDWLNITGDESPVSIPDLSSTDWTDRQYRLAGEFIRRHHARLAHEIAIHGFPVASADKVLALPDGLDHLKNLAGVVARSHGMPLAACRKYLRDQLRDEARPYGVYAFFLMGILRIADYLQIRSDRAPKVRDRLQPLRSPISQREWAKHWAIQAVNPDGQDPEALRVYAHADSLESQRELLAFLADIQKEIDGTWKALGAVYGQRPQGKKLRLAIRWLVHNLDEDESLLRDVERLTQAEHGPKGTLSQDDVRRSVMLRMIHELKRPVVTIQAAADILRMELGEFEKRSDARVLRRDYVDDILTWSSLMSQILTSTGMIIAGSSEPVLERLSLLRDVIAPAVGNCRASLRERGVSLSAIAVSDAGTPQVRGDRHQLRQAIWQLLHNAVLYADRDPTSFRVEVECFVQDKEVAIRVRDWGVGVDPSLSDAIFKQGFRSPIAVQMVVGGIGMGLALARQIAESHGGQLLLTNPSNPTEFTFKLPLTHR